MRDKITLSVDEEVLRKARGFLSDHGMPVSRQFEQGIKLFFERQEEMRKNG